MIRTGFAVACVMAVLFLTSGCNTISCTAHGAVDGAKKDYKEAKKADAWLQENLW